MANIVIGQKVGQYEIVAKAGVGGMATVYKAYQPSISRYVAIKVLAQDFAKDPNFVQRFEGEARAVALLEHPNILPVYDFGSQQELIYMVMRYIDTGTLTDLIYKEQYLSYAVISQIAGQVASALDYAHQHNIIHRDIKPSNMLVDSLGNILLTDFGLAKVISSSPQSRITRTGTVVGTASYMSPEQASDEVLDGRSDIYSLGVVLFELLSGSLPFAADTPVATALKHVNSPPPPLRSINSHVPEMFEPILQKALAKWPDERYQTASDLSHDLNQAIDCLDDKSATVNLPVSVLGQPPQPVAPLVRTTNIKTDSPRPSFSQNKPVQATPPPGNGLPAILKKPWVWVAVILATSVTSAAIIIMFYFFWQVATPTIPKSSLLNNIPDNADIAQVLGEQEASYARSNYSRQNFEGGAMIWWDNPNNNFGLIYLLPGDPQALSGTNWARYKDNWSPIYDPEVPARCPEASGPNGPIRGFGQLWCYTPGIRDTLQMPTGPEATGNDATFEQFSGGLLFSVPVDNQIWVLFNEDGTWRKFDNLQPQ